MKLVSFSLKNYRSIRSAERIVLGDFTILIGPNNEGKSNILRGLVVGMQMLSAGASYRVSRIRNPAGQIIGSNKAEPDWFRTTRGGELYNWDRDFPISLQDKTPPGKSVFDFEFELDDGEILEFKEKVKSNLNGLLPIRLTLGPGDVTFEVRKRGRGAATLTAKRLQIAQFIGTRLNMKDVPSVRTARSASELVDEMVRLELKGIEATPEYRSAVDQIAAIQAPILHQIETTVEGMLKTFLPEVKSVKVDVEDRYDALRRNSRLIVDDGTPTELRYKGDGVQSLAAISLIHNLSQQAAGASKLVLAIEEPEAHLHPRAIHQLRAVLQDIASRQQVVITTHSPLLVNRSQIGSNVIVDRNKARTARSVAEIRTILGVRVSDNLAAAEVVLVVEGEDDRASLLALLPRLSIRIRNALTQSTLALDSLHGASNLVYRLSNLRDQLCVAHVFLDHDASGISCAQRAEVEGLLRPADRTFATSPGMDEAELEDLYDIELYADMIQREYNVNLRSAKFRKRNRKWKDRVRDAFQSSGQLWGDDVERSVKAHVARLVVAKPDSALFRPWSSALDALVVALESKLT